MGLGNINGMSCWAALCVRPIFAFWENSTMAFVSKVTTMLSPKRPKAKIPRRRALRNAWRKSVCNRPYARVLPINIGFSTDYQHVRRSVRTHFT